MPVECHASRSLAEAESTRLVRAGLLSLIPLTPLSSGPLTLCRVYFVVVSAHAAYASAGMAAECSLIVERIRAAAMPPEARTSPAASAPAAPVEAAAASPAAGAAGSAGAPPLAAAAGRPGPGGWQSLSLSIREGRNRGKTSTGRWKAVRDGEVTNGHQRNQDRSQGDAHPFPPERESARKSGRASPQASDEGNCSDVGSDTLRNGRWDSRHAATAATTQGDNRQVDSNGQVYTRAGSKGCCCDGCAAGAECEGAAVANSATHELEVQGGALGGREEWDTDCEASRERVGKRVNATVADVVGRGKNEVGAECLPITGERGTVSGKADGSRSCGDRPLQRQQGQQEEGQHHGKEYEQLEQHGQAQKLQGRQHEAAEEEEGDSGLTAMWLSQAEDVAEVRVRREDIAVVNSALNKVIKAHAQRRDADAAVMVLRDMQGRGEQREGAR